MALANQVMAFRGSLGISDRACLVFVRMATTALDRPKGDQPDAQYFGGWDPLAIVLGYPDARSSAAESAVARCMRELAGAGCIKRVGEQTSRRKNATYALTIPGGIPR